MQEAPRLTLDKNLATFELAKTLVPGGVAGIRRPYNFVEGEYPIYFTSGKGCRIRDVDRNEYIDFLCAYGPIILGYRETEIDEAVIDKIREDGFCFSLTQPIQNRLVEKLRELIPSCEMAALVKTGSDATTLAIRVARCYTDRLKIIRCGYHGWHDWCVEVKGGIPEKLYEDVHEFHYNNLGQLEELLKQHGSNTAGIIVTPYGHPLALPLEDPQPGFLEGVRKLADDYGCVLIFDEIRTGFRVNIGGAQQEYGVTPDLSCFGKAMANGYEISALVGKTQFMKTLEKKAFVSSTFFPNSLAMVAALKTIEIMQRDKVLETMRERGSKFIATMQEIVEEADCGAEFSGTPMMQFITFPKDAAGLYKEKRRDFYAQLIRRGIFMQPYHHGYICYRHTDDDLQHANDMIAESLAYVKAKY